MFTSMHSHTIFYLERLIDSWKCHNWREMQKHTPYSSVEYFIEYCNSFFSPLLWCLEPQPVLWLTPTSLLPHSTVCNNLPCHVHCCSLPYLLSFFTMSSALWNLVLHSTMSSAQYVYHTCPMNYHTMSSIILHI